jgi:hypothetical protein
MEEYGVDEGNREDVKVKKGWNNNVTSIVKICKGKKVKLALCLTKYHATKPILCLIKHHAMKTYNGVEV